MADQREDNLGRRKVVNTIAMVLLVVVAIVLFAVFGNRPDTLL